MFYLYSPDLSLIMITCKPSLCRYPVRVQETATEDPRCITEHNKAILEEMKKQKPRDTVLLPLMKNTFQDRRMFIQNDATSVAEILQIYPALMRQAVVSSLVLRYVHMRTRM